MNLVPTSCATHKETSREKVTGALQNYSRIRPDAASLDEGMGGTSLN